MSCLKIVARVAIFCVKLFAFYDMAQLYTVKVFGTMIKYEINEMPYAKKYDFKLVF